MSVHENKFLGITFILVLLLGAVTLLSLYDPEDYNLTISNQSLSELTEVDLGGKNLRERQPASIPPTSSMHTPTANHVNLNPSCDKQEEYNIKVKGTTFQIEGKHCSAKMKQNSFEIVNLTNGFTASVFDQVGSGFQTDLVQLKKGANNLVIRFHAADGKLIEKKLNIISED